MPESGNITQREIEAEDLVIQCASGVKILDFDARLSINVGNMAVDYSDCFRFNILGGLR